MKMVEVGNEKMESLFTIVWNKGSGAFYIKRGYDIICRGTKGGDFCHIGGKPSEELKVLEFVQFYPSEGILCLRPIIRFSFNPSTHIYNVSLRGKRISSGKAEGIAADGCNEKYPHLRYYTLVKKIA